MRLKSAVSLQVIVWLALICINLIIISVPVSALPAENETPLKLATVVFEPYYFAWGDDGSSDVIDASSLHGYSITLYQQKSAGTNPMDAQLIQFYYICVGDNYGIIFISSHGSSSGFAVEAYEHTAAGEAARDAQYNDYINQGFTAEEIYRASSDDGYHISVTPHALQSWFVDAKTIVYLSTCDGATFSGSWGAREVLSYTGSVSHATAKADANTFWGHMDGTIDGGTKRPVSKAKEGTSLTHTGTGNTVLSPKVKGHGGSPVVFDCKMDTSIDPATVVTAPPDEAILTNWQWVGDDTISFYVFPLKPLIHFTVHADKAISGNNGAKLDGNWVGPNGDDYLYEEAEHPVGGIVVPVDKFGLLTPYIGLASTILVAAVATALYVKRVKHRKENQQT